MGSYDGARNLLTIVQYTLPAGATEYVNSLWEDQAEPYGGDVVNSYNDGPVEPGAEALGGFYELESSSPAAALAPGGSITHVHRTFHLSGPREHLSDISTAVLGVDLAQVQAALGH